MLSHLLSADGWLAWFIIILLADLCSAFIFEYSRDYLVRRFGVFKVHKMTLDSLKTVSKLLEGKKKKGNITRIRTLQKTIKELTEELVKEKQTKAGINE